MSSDKSALSVPKTAVVRGIADPVEEARAELQAALYAIEDKVNIPKQVERKTVQARAYARREPVNAALVAVGIALAVGGVVWAGVRALTR